MKAKLLLIAVVGLFIAGAASSEAQTFTFPSIDSPAIVQNGIDSYRTDGAAAALKTWLKGSSLAKKEAKDTDLQEQLLAFEATGGALQRFEQIGTISISPSVRVGWYALCYANGVAFAEFTAYQGQSSWIITSLKFSTNYRDILPNYQFSLK